MKFPVKNTFTALKVPLSILIITGFWTNCKEVSYKMRCYTFCSFMFMTGLAIITQFVDLIKVWGDVPLMTGTSFLLFTNVALGLKQFNLTWRREEVRALIEESDANLQAVDTNWGREVVRRCERNSTKSFFVYTSLPYITIVGWAWGSEKGELPTRAWYPYNITTTPSYELTYFHQVAAIACGAGVNVSMDTVVIALMAQYCCRLQLLSTSLRMLGDGLLTNNQGMFKPDQEVIIKARIRYCVQQHKSVLEAAGLLQKHFSSPIFAQFLVSMVAICVTAYQLAFETSNMIAQLAMVMYFICMAMQVFLYCYQGDELSYESGQIGGAVYESPWYQMSMPLRKDLLMVMVRSQRIAKITAGGFTTLSLDAFMAIIKTSYTLFTVLQTDEI